MKVSLKIYLTDHKKIMPYIQENNHQYTLIWKSWKFSSMKDGMDFSLAIPEFVAEIPDDTLFQDISNLCKELSNKLECLIQGDSYSPRAKPGCGFHGCFENGEYKGFTPLRSNDEIERTTKNVRSQWKMLDIAIEGRKYN